MKSKTVLSIIIAGAALLLAAWPGAVCAQSEKAADSATAQGEHGTVALKNQSVMPETPADQKLADEVLNRIENHTLYGIFDWVTVKAHSGVVTLNGWAALPWHSRQFAHQAAKVSGVSKVINNVKLESQLISDDEIRQTVSRLVYLNTFERPYSKMPGYPVHIIVNSGDVTLEGSVNTELMSTRAEQAAYSATNAYGVTNNLHVED
jgi:osmotically-inducible protein OsmY